MQKNQKKRKSINNEVRRPFLDMAIELRKWFNNQHRWKTQKDFANDIGIPYSTLKKYFKEKENQKEKTDTGYMK